MNHSQHVTAPTFVEGASALVLLALCHSCSSPKPTQWPGASTATATEPSPPEPTTPLIAKRQLVIAPERLATFVTATDQPYPSEGHEPPNYLVHVLVNPEAVQHYRNWPRSRTLPPGTWLVARHSYRVNPPPSQKPLPLYTMYLEPKGWIYGAITQDGWNVPVVTEVCHDCHTQARAQSVFGLPSRVGITEESTAD